ncbi:hypothetical protein HDU97_007015 [Phlyctochytrium planicorne]|nr:hypothetical protein HDU97_007015 [Phlyctochytrium planicorne]
MTNSKVMMAFATIAIALAIVPSADAGLQDDLTDPDIKYTPCFTNPDQFGWDTMRNFTQSKRTITLEQAGWDSARLATRLLQIILTEIMGFKVLYQEYQAGYSVTSARLRAGNITDIAMEVWYSHGSIGYQGRSGMYLPSRFVSTFPEFGYDFWRFFQNPKARANFITHGKGPKIRNKDGSYICDNAPGYCVKGRYVPDWFTEAEADNFVEMWLPYPGWSQYRYQRMIDGLKLNATLNWLGEGFDDIVTSYLANTTGPGILFYNWVPTMFIAATTNKFVNEFPDVSKLLANYIVRDDAINAMLKDMSANVTYMDSACKWMKNNPTLWTNWIPPPPKSYEKCPYGTGRFLSDGIGICLTCPSDSYSWKENTTEACHACPHEGICPGGGTVNVKKGYFLAPPTSSKSITPDFYHCPYREACCPSGNCTMTSSCADGFTGLLCTECSDPNQALWRGKCIDCEKAGSSLYLLIFMSFFATFALLFVPRHELPTVELLFFFFQVINLIFGASLGELLGFGELKTFLALASLDMDGMAVDCPAKLTGVSKLMFRFLLPSMFFVHLGLLYGIFSTLKKFKVPVEKIFPYYLKDQSMDAIFFKGLLTIITFVMMPLLEASVSLLECRTIVDKVVLHKAPTVECFKGSHVGPVTIAIIILVIILGALPLTIFVVLNNLKRANQITYDKHGNISHYEQMLQNLYLQYKPEFLFVEAYFILERGAIVIFFTVFSEDNKWSAFGYILLIGAIMLVRVYVQPFQSQLEAYLSREVCQCWLILLAFKYTAYQPDALGIAPYVIAIMFLPPTLHIVRLITSLFKKGRGHFGNSNIKKSIEDLAKSVAGKNKNHDDSERVPLSTENLND